MRRWAGPLVVLILTAALAHWLTLVLGPGFIMNRAMAALEARGVALHAFTTPLRVTPTTQQVVRSSPDLYYALCRYDLAQAEPDDAVTTAVAVSMAKWDGYQSLSFFDANTNNFATLRGTGEQVRVTLVRAEGGNGGVLAASTEDAGPYGRDVVVHSPTATGVILIRRLAPSAEAFAKALQVGALDDCKFGLTLNKVY